MSGVQGVLSKICCCIEIETGGLIVAITRLLLHLTRIMIAIILLMSGIPDGVELTTEIMETTTGGGTTAAGGDASEAPEVFVYSYDRVLTKDQTDTLRERKKK